MRVLVLGECSGVISGAFRAAGWEAWSLDLKKTDAEPRWHVVESWDAYFIRLPHTLESWDLVIWHPECTKVCVSGNHVYAAGKSRHAERLEAQKYIKTRWEILKAKTKRAALENPRGTLGRVLGKYGCTVQPYECGDDASKQTDWWLHNLPPIELIADERVPGRLVCCGKTLAVGVGKYGCPNCHGAGRVVERWANQTDSGQNKLGPNENRAAERAETYPGIARALVRSWGRLA